MGVQSSERVPRMEEGIQLLRAFWGPEPVSHRGRFYTFEEVQALPKPVQRRVPLIIASNPAINGDPATEERVLRRIARLADGWQTDGTPAAVFRDRWTRIRQYAAEAGRAHEVTDASLHLMVNINPDAEHARRESVEFLDRYYGTGAIAGSKIEHWLAAGPVSAVIDKIALFLEAGCTTPILRFTSPDQRRQLDQFLERVAPTLTTLGARLSGATSLSSLSGMSGRRVAVGRRRTKAPSDGSSAPATESRVRSTRVRRSLASEAYVILKGRILRCEIAPGERLTEARLVRELGLGKTPIREALVRLIHDRLVRNMPRHGYEVTPITLADVEDLFRLRLILEPAAMGLAAGRIDVAAPGPPAGAVSGCVLLAR